MHRRALCVLFFFLQSGWPHFANTALVQLYPAERMGAAESRAHLEESTSVPVLTINGEIEDETGREAGFASDVTPEQAAAAEA